MMRIRLRGTLAATVVEAPTLYWFLRFEHDGHRVWPVLLLMAGEVLETGYSGRIITRALRARDLAEPAVAQRHMGMVMQRMGALSLAEVVIWVAWLLVVSWLGQWAGFGVLAVLMHVKHQAEASTVRDTPFSTGLVSLRMISASLFEVVGAAGSLALIRDGRLWPAAASLVAGLAIEHTILVDLLQRELDTRDIRVPRVPRARRPRPGPTVGLVEWIAGNFGPLWRVSQAIGPVRRFLNRLAINKLIGAVPYRPDPLSTMASYTSWASLTDRTWSGRHLSPVQPPPVVPPVDAVAALFRRGPEALPCPKSTVLFPCFAQWFTDGFLRTDRSDPQVGKIRDTKKNESTHQVDLSQLYGLNAEMTDQLRTKTDGLLKSLPVNGECYPEYLCRGGRVKPEFDKLLPAFGFDQLTPAEKNELFAMGTDTRNLGFMAFNVLFLREHNRIARDLGKHYPEWNDERLFATARMILIVVLIKIVVVEYINHINAFHFKFSLHPESFSNEPWQRPNWMAIEFNLLYRWHSLVPTRFEVGGRDLTIEETLNATRVLTATGLGRFMAAASGQRAGRIGLFNTDPFLVAAAETPSIVQARNADLRSYNDYRALCHLPVIKRYEDLSANPEVCERLSALYGEDVDNLEFYVGLFAEEAGPNNVLPPLMTAMVSFDAFSQVLTNPLVAPRIYGAQTFSARGMEIIDETKSISQLVHRNIPENANYRISLTRQDYQRV